MAEEYAAAVTKAAVAHICQDRRFTGIQESALDSLVDITKRYIEQIGRRSRAYAEQGCRTESNVHDVLGALEEMGVSSEKLKMFATHATEIPFGQSIPPFPVRRKAVPPGASVPPLEEGGGRPAYVPPFLPEFPPKRTYMSTPAYQKAVDPKTMRKEKDAQKRAAETALTSLGSSFSTPRAPATATRLSQTYGKMTPLAPTTLSRIPRTPVTPSQNWAHVAQREDASSIIAPGELVAAVRTFTPSGKRKAEEDVDPSPGQPSKKKKKRAGKDLAPIDMK